LRVRRVTGHFCQAAKGTLAPGRLLAVDISVALRKGVAALPQHGPSFHPAHVPVPIPLHNSTAVVNCGRGRGLGCAAKGYIRPCVGFTTDGLEVGWRWPRWCSKSSCHSAMSISTAFIAPIRLLQSPAPERRRRSFPRRSLAMTRTTTIARSAPRSSLPRTLSCSRRRNCRCRLFLDQSSTSLASRSISSCRGVCHFNPALRRSPDRLLLILGIAALFLRRRCSQDGTRPSP